MKGQENKILVTGGLGYIGSHTCVELIQNGLEVVIVDNLSNSKLEVLDRIEKITGVKPDFHQIDVTNKKELASVFSTYSLDKVIHFAAYKAVGESQKLAADYYYNNLNSLTILLSVMKEFDIKKLVFSSSCTVYGTADKIPVDESESIKNAESVYGTTKIMGEKIIADITQSEFQLKAVILRYFNPVGAHESGLIGENPNGVPNNLFPVVLEAINGTRESLAIFGNDYDTKDGTAVRDYIHVVDLAQAHVQALNYLDKSDSRLDYFNIGTGVGNSVLEVIQQFEKEINKPINYSFEKRREGDIEKIWADSSKALKKMNWKATHRLEDMVKSSMNWNKQKNGK